MKLKVLMFGWEFPPHNSGGLGIACEGLTDALTKMDIEVYFVLPKELKIEGKQTQFVFPKKGNHKLQIKYIQSDIKPYGSYEYLNASTKVKDLLNISLNSDQSEYQKDLVNDVLVYSTEAKKIAEELDFDVIHAHDWLSFGAGIAAKEVSNKPLVTHIHATQFDHSGGNYGNPVIHNLEEEGLHASDKIIAVSEFTKNIVVNQYGVNHDKVEVVHNGIDAEKIAEHEIDTELLSEFKKKGKRIVLFLGRMALMKNPDGLLKAAKLSLEMDPNLIFVFAGSGEMQGQLIEDSAREGIADKVFFPGFIRGALKHSLFNSADLFVMPSLSEPFGLVALESILNETPVLISKQSGVSDVLNHSLKVDFWDVKEMANKIVTVTKYKSIQNTLLENSKKEVDNLTWNKAAEKVVDIYKSVMRDS